MKYAGFWKRFVAAILDVLILILPLMALNWVLPVAGSIVLCILYYPVFESSSLQATPGKFWMGLKVLNENGQTLSFPRAVARFLLKYVSSLILMIGYLMQLFTEKRQTLHDLVVNAVVIDQVSTVSTPDWFDIWMKNMRYVLKVDQSAPVVDVQATSSTSTTTSTSTAVEAIEKLHELYKNGVLTEEEFQNKKAELLKQV